MLKIFALLVSALPLASLAGPFPDLICLEGRVQDINPRTLQAKEYESSSTYRFADQKLYLKSAGRDEYLYGAVVEGEPGRYVVGHKTIYISTQAPDAPVLQLTHVYKDEVRVSVARCNKP